jgi:hypothetical protein
LYYSGSYADQPKEEIVAQSVRPAVEILKERIHEIQKGLPVSENEKDEEVFTEAAEQLEYGPRFHHGHFINTR